MFSAIMRCLRVERLNMVNDEVPLFWGDSMTFWTFTSVIRKSIVPNSEVVAKLVVICLSAVNPRVFKNIFLQTYVLTKWALDSFTCTVVFLFTQLTWISACIVSWTTAVWASSSASALHLIVEQITNNHVTAYCCKAFQQCQGISYFIATKVKHIWLISK